MLVHVGHQGLNTTENEVGLATGDEVETWLLALGKLLGEVGIELGIDGALCRTVAHGLHATCCTREEAYVAELLVVVARDGLRVETTHRKAGDGTRVLVGLAAEVLLDEAHHFGEVELEGCLGNALTAYSECTGLSKASS